jgi:hypothetical protein
MKNLAVCLCAFLAGGAWAQGRFRTPVNEVGVNTPNSPNVNEYHPALTGDQLDIWWTSDRPGGAGAYDIWHASRPTIAAPWGAAQNETVLNTANQEQYITVSNDGTEIYISTNRTGGLGAYDLWRATRANRTSPWNAPVHVPELNSTAQDEDPALVGGDTLEIFFTSARAGTLGTGDLWRSTRPNLGSPWTAPVRVAELATTAYDHSAAPSDDGLTLFFASLGLGGLGSSDFFVTRRPDRNSPFVAGVNVTECNTIQWEFNPDLASDEFSFYISTYPGGVPGGDVLRADSILPRTVSSGPARVGLPWSVWCRRDPNVDVGGLALSTSSIPGGLPVPGVQGLLYLGFPLVVLTLGVCDANGQVAVAFPAIPNAPGVQVFFQSFAQDPMGTVYLGNLLTVTIVP